MPCRESSVLRRDQTDPKPRRLQVQDMKDASSEAARHYTAARVEFVEGMAQIEVSTRSADIYWLIDYLHLSLTQKLFHEKITRMETLAAKLITLRLSCAKDLDSSHSLSLFYLGLLADI
jgi:hypothetical protein